MSIKINMSIKIKLYIGLGTVMGIFLLVSLNTYYRINQTVEIQDRLLHLRHPTVIAGIQLQNGVNQSLAGLRGYMILGSNPDKASLFKAERASSWEQIDIALARFRDLSTDWTVDENINLLDEMVVVVEEFRQTQDQVEGIAQSIENIPAYKILLTEAAPRAAEVIKAIGQLIDMEESLPANAERKRLLKLMADSRGSFALGLANIRAYLLSGDPAFREKFAVYWRTNEARFKQLNQSTALFSPAQLSAWKAYAENRSSFVKFPPLMFASRSAADWNKANYLLGTEAAPRANRIKVILQKLRDSQDELSAVDEDLLTRQSELMILMMKLGTVIAIVFGIGVLVYLCRYLSGRLSGILAKTQAIASGDLTGSELNSSGNDELAELGNAINQMGNNLFRIVHNVSESSNSLAAAAEQLSCSAGCTYEGIQNQRQETKQAAASMAEMATTVQQVTKSTHKAARSASQADDEVKSGRDLVGENMNAICKLAGDMEKTASTINKLGEDTEGVDEIVEVISSIADQTNLLALNAAIEAARAGEQGRGFAVVADEVRTLAARTQESTEEIRAMLSGLKSSVELAVNAMKAGHTQARQSVEHANNVGSSLDSIAAAVSKINDMNLQIATASEQQSAVAEEMNNNLNHINGESENTLVATHDTSEASQHVKEMATSLQQAVGYFKV